MMMDIIIPTLLPYLDTSSIACISCTNKDMYMLCYHKLDNLYTSSDVYKSNTVVQLNELSKNIDRDIDDEQQLFDFIIMCYDNWKWLSKEEWRFKLNIPKSSCFNRFLIQRNLKMEHILPTYNISYTHVHRPSKQFAKFHTINFS